jgi:uncharacterized membrane protein
MKTPTSVRGLYKRVSASQRDFVTTLSNQATIRKLRKPRKSLAAVAFGLLLSVPGLVQAQLVQAPITIDVTIDGNPATRTAANGNSTNEIVGEFDDADENTHGFVLNKGVFTQIDVPPALAPGTKPGVVATSINGINAPGQLVGTYVVANGMPPTTTPHAFFENEGNFLTLDPPGSIRSQGGFINAQSQVVGTYRDANQKRHGFIWRNGTFTTFNVTNKQGEIVDHDLFGTVALGINDIGAVVGDYVAKDETDLDNPHRHGFLRSSKGDFTTFDVPDAVLTIGEGINNAGTIVGVYVLADGIHHGFVLKNGVFMTVDVPDSKNGNAPLPTDINSINAKGEIVGSYDDSHGTHGFLGVPVR